MTLLKGGVSRRQVLTDIETAKRLPEGEDRLPGLGTVEIRPVEVKYSPWPDMA